MDKIASFQVNHNKLMPGLYLSRVDGDIVTYDLRFAKPNTPPFLETAAMHTIEHLFATMARNSDLKDHVVYFGPMGCRTGFYFLLRATSHEQAVAFIKKIIRDIAEFKGEIPGTTAMEITWSIIYPSRKNTPLHIMRSSKTGGRTTLNIRLNSFEAFCKLYLFSKKGNPLSLFKSKKQHVSIKNLKSYLKSTLYMTYSCHIFPGIIRPPNQSEIKNKKENYYGRKILPVLRYADGTRR